MLLRFQKHEDYTQHLILTSRRLLLSETYFMNKFGCPDSSMPHNTTPITATQKSTDSVCRRAALCLSVRAGVSNRFPTAAITLQHDLCLADSVQQICCFINAAS